MPRVFKAFLSGNTLVWKDMKPQYPDSWPVRVIPQRTIREQIVGIATKILFALLALSTVIVLYPSMAGARKRAIMSQARIYFEQCSEMLEFPQEQVFSCEDPELELSKPRAVIKSYVLRGTGADYTLVVLAGQGNHSVTLEGNVEKGMTVLQNH